MQELKTKDLIPFDLEIERAYKRNKKEGNQAMVENLVNHAQQAPQNQHEVNANNRVLVDLAIP